MSLDGSTWSRSTSVRPVVLAWQRETGADLARVNVCGGAIASATRSALPAPAC